MGTVTAYNTVGTVSKSGVIDGVTLTPWGPIQLFADGEQGAFYNLNDTSTLYQTSAATSLADAVGDPIGLVTDIRRALNPADNVLVLDGASGDYASTPDSVANSITGDIDIRAFIQPDDWTPAASGTVAAKWNATGDQRSYLFYIAATTGRPNFLISTDGTATAGAIQTYTATASPTVSDGGTLYVRVTLDVDNGAADSDCTFYVSADGVTWVQLGAVVNSGSTESIFDGTAVCGVGAYDGGTNSRLIGNVYNTQIYNGIDGTLAVDFNPQDKTAVGATWPSSTTGETWTQNGTARVVPSWSNYAVQGTAGSRPVLGIFPKSGVRNILISTDTLATQNATTAASEYTLSFKGTGTVTLTGTSTAGPLVGTGVNDTVTLTFTPTAGTLTLTVSGTVEEAQLELGDARTVYQTVGSAWYNVTENGGTIGSTDHYTFAAFDGTDDFFTVPGTDSAWKFLHDGTGGYVASGVQFGTVPNPGVGYRLLESRTNGGGVTGFGLFYLDSGGNDNNVSAQSNNGATILYTNLSANGDFPAMAMGIVSHSFDLAQSPDANLSVNGSLVSSGNAGSAVDTGNASRAFNIGRESGGSYLRGAIPILIVRDGVPTAAVENKVTSYIAQEIGVS